MAEAGFKGSLADFLKFLKTDPQFYAKTPDELMGVSAYVLARVNGKVGKVIGTFAAAPLRPCPSPGLDRAFLHVGTRGRSQLDCTMNTYNLPTRPLYNIPALTLHECAPGHSLQTAIPVGAEGAAAIPPQRLFLGHRRGLGPLQRMARQRDGNLPHALRAVWPAELRDVARRAAGDRHRHPPLRLVARSRRSTISPTTPRCPATRSRPRSTATSAGPAQALSYKIGELTIRRLRSEAEAELGPKFDERGFHDTILALGRCPCQSSKSRFTRGSGRKPQSRRRPIRSASPGRYNRRRSWPARPSARCRRAPPHRRTP